MTEGTTLHPMRGLENALAYLLIGVFLIGLVAWGLDAAGVIHLGHIVNSTHGLGDR